MHPVLEHILARKGKSVPVDDGRKIALVLFGGIMTGVRGCGATIALHELGLDAVFDEVHTYSGGFPNASYFLANQARVSASVYYEELCKRKFINFFRLWKIADIDFLIRTFQGGEKKLDVQTILRNSTKLFVTMLNSNTKRWDQVEVHSMNEQEYFTLLRAAVSMPYIGSGPTRVGNKLYEDVGISREFVNYFLTQILDSDLTDILIIYCRADQREKNIPTTNRVCEIIPAKEWNMSKYTSNTRQVRNAALQMGNFVKSAFGSNESIQLL